MNELETLGLSHEDRVELTSNLVATFRQCLSATQYVKDLDEIGRSVHATRSPAGAVLQYGVGGIGKTRLLAEIQHRLRGWNEAEKSLGDVEKSYGAFSNGASHARLIDDIGFEVRSIFGSYRDVLSAIEQSELEIGKIFRREKPHLFNKCLSSTGELGFVEAYREWLEPREQQSYFKAVHTLIQLILETLDQVRRDVRNEFRSFLRHIRRSSNTIDFTIEFISRQSFRNCRPLLQEGAIGCSDGEQLRVTPPQNYFCRAGGFNAAI